MITPQFRSFAEQAPATTFVPKARPYEGVTRGPAFPTLTVVPIDMFARDANDNEVRLGCATAFCDLWDGRPHLVTNWHNVTGRDPHNGQPKASDSVVPSFVRAHFLEIQRHEEGFGYQPGATFQADLPVENWVMHQDGQAIDIAAVRLDEDERRLLPAMNSVARVYDPLLEVGSDLFILGYPRGLRPTGNFPIWKRGFIASEPKWWADGERCFWIDAATREGMSGSPVVTWADSALEDILSMKGGFESPGIDSVRLTEPGWAFAGVYSGRMGKADALEAQLGKVWHAPTVQEMLENPRQLDYVIK